MVAIAVICALSHTGCGPTYPREIVDKAIIQLCREEYDVEVKVEIAGNTVGVYIPIENLFDPTLNISQEAAEKINDVILSVSRVTLSTDAPLDFYIVIAQDPMLAEIEVVLIRYVKDIKMLHYSRISRGEFSSRLIISIKLTPQAQKEKVLRNIFSKLNIQESDKLVTEYLETSKVTTIGDIGYWQDTFYIKDIGMGEFLGLQIADRVKAEFAPNKPLGESYKLNSIKGEYLEEGGKNFFEFTFNVRMLGEEDVNLSEEADDAAYDVILEAAADVLLGYKFDDFWNIEIVNAMNKKVLFVKADELEALRNKKIKKEELRQWYR